jgi:hypothetical protein
MITLLSKTLTAAETAAVTTADGLDLPFARGVLLQFNFTYGSGGTNGKFWVQSSADGGATWCDVACFAVTTSSARRLFNLRAQTPVTSIATPTDGTLADNTAVDGLLGEQLRVKYTTTGTYAGGTTINITAVPR